MRVERPLGIEQALRLVEGLPGCASNAFRLPRDTLRVVGQRPSERVAGTCVTGTTGHISIPLNHATDATC